MNRLPTLEWREPAEGLALTMVLAQGEIRGSAADLVFGVLGDPGDAARRFGLDKDRTMVLETLHRRVFIGSGDDLEIREGVEIHVGDEPLDPETPVRQLFEDAQGPVVLTVRSDDEASRRSRHMQAYALMGLVWAARAEGLVLPADKVDRLGDLLLLAERRDLLRHEPSRHRFVLTETGSRMAAGLAHEAEDLVHRFDMFADVTGLSGGSVRFGAGHGEDLRIPMWERAGIEPFRARFVLGLLDGEVTEEPDFPMNLIQPGWFGRFFAPVEHAPHPDDLPPDALDRVADAAADDGLVEETFVTREGGMSPWWWALILL
ncbi:MAG: hypothetical protein VKP57_00840 [Candidatus Sericytochromatia bacterium]|nr:hypothetical protein [Candidatus Sericytochromatia bacterium]